MKKPIHLLWALALLLSVPVFGQDYGYFRLGYQYNDVYLGNLNRNIYVYNYTRDWLEQKMHYVSSLAGINMAYGHIGEKLGAELYWSMATRNTRAFGLEPTSGAVGNRSVNTGVRNLGITVFRNRENKHIAFRYGLGLSRNRFFVNTRYTNDGTGENEFDLIFREPYWAVTGMAEVGLYGPRWLGVTVRPFYQYALKRVDIGDFPYYFQGANYPFGMYDRPNIWGVTTCIMLAPKRDPY